VSFFSRHNHAGSGRVPGGSSEVDAARWFARRELGLLRGDEADTLERWRKDPQNEAALDSIAAALEQSRSAAATPGIVRMRDEALAYRPPTSRTLGNIPSGLAAAVLVIALTATLILHESGQDVTAPSSATASTDLAPVSANSIAASTNVYATRKGEIRAVKLLDGSLLTLNTDSRVEVALTPTQRRLSILSGQALFNVAHDKNRPFVVTAGPVEVTAVGTQFDIHIGQRRTEVVVLEGRVRIEPLARRGIARFISALDRRYLDPGQRLVAQTEGELSVAVADTERATSWRHGRLIFRGEPLEDAVAEFNRYSEHQIIIEDTTLARLPVSGVFSSARPKNFLAAVADFYSMRIEERGPQLTVLSLRKE